MLGYHKGPWHAWFAWRPTYVGEGYIWLRTVFRRKCTDWDACPVPEDYFEYRVTRP